MSNAFAGGAVAVLRLGDRCGNGQSQIRGKTRSVLFDEMPSTCCHPRPSSFPAPNRCGFTAIEWGTQSCSWHEVTRMHALSGLSSTAGALACFQQAVQEIHAWPPWHESTASPALPAANTGRGPPMPDRPSP